jgi:hypothetical protein
MVDKDVSGMPVNHKTKRRMDQKDGNQQGNAQPHQSVAHKLPETVPVERRRHENR